MTFLLDHDVPDEVGQMLRHWGHEVVHLRDVLPANSTDADVFASAQARAMIILSCNRDDFLSLAKEACGTGSTFGGLVILIRRRTRQAECAHLLGLLRRAGPGGISGNINFA